LTTGWGARLRQGADVDDASAAKPADKTHRIMARLSAFVATWPPKTAGWVAFGLVVALATADASLGFEPSLLALYPVPLALATWAGVPRLAYALAAVAVTLPMPFSLLEGQPIGWALLWGVSSNLVLLGIIAILFSSLKRRLSDEAAFVATDTLTGLPTRGSFMRQLDAELARAGRYGRAFTLAYIDLDNFKSVNDLEGHDTGDELLRRVADALRRSTRQTDILGRLGGDEFAAVLPEIAGGATGSVLDNLRKQLTRAMDKGGWPVTFSIGAVTFEAPVDTSREALQVADVAMYAVKRAGKDGIRHAVWDGAPVASIENSVPL
jgi:diguanylate cyclase (GGDEF)-like protein